jgi:predicted PurR-regulated permease PerM
MKENEVTKIEITPKTIATTIGMILLLVLAWIIKPVIFMVFVAFIMNAAFRPYVDKLEKYKIPRFISTIIIIILVALIVVIGLVTIVNEAFIQLKVLFEQLPNIVYMVISNAEKVFPVISQYVDPTIIKSTLKDSMGGLVNFSPTILTSGVTGAFDLLNSTISMLFTSMMVIIMSVYMISRKENVYDGLLLSVNKKNRKKYLDLLSKIEIKLGEWLRTQLFIMLLVGVIVWCGISLPALFTANYSLASYALPLAFLAMILEIVPGTGVGVTGILAALIALGSNQPYLALYVGIFFIALQQIETSYILPTIMNKVVGVDPLVMIVGFVSFYMLFGPIGAILGVPMLIVIQLLIDFGVDGVIDQK